jgi:hypothetical protein
MEIIEHSEFCIVETGSLITRGQARTAWRSNSRTIRGGFCSGEKRLWAVVSALTWPLMHNELVYGDSAVHSEGHVGQICSLTF